MSPPGSTVGCAAALAACVVVSGPANAHADERVVAGPGNRYLSEAVEIDQGEPLTLVNQDVAAHNVTSRQDGADGQALFATRTIDRGQEAFVEASQYLSTGNYAFYCTLHPSMEGRLNVNAAGAPVPRPGSEGGDRRAPAAAVRVRDRRIQTVVRRRALSVTFETDEPATLRLTATAKLGRRTLRLGVLQRSLERSGGRSLAVPLRADARRALRRARGAKVHIAGSATDAAGNAADLGARRTLRR